MQVPYHIVPILSSQRLGRLAWLTKRLPQIPPNTQCIWLAAYYTFLVQGSVNKAGVALRSESSYL